MSGQPRTTPWHTTGSRQVYANPWLAVREDQVRRPDGSPGVYGVIEIPDYAGVVAVDESGRVAMVRQWRYLYADVSLEVPAGNGAAGDRGPLDTAMRELLEETGLTARDWVALGPIRYSVATNIGHLYLARGLAPGERPAGTDDWTELLWMDYREVIDRVLAGEIMESTSVGALLKAEAMRQRGDWSL